jgi:hypothetical protein
MAMKLISREDIALSGFHLRSSQDQLGPVDPAPFFFAVTSSSRIPIDEQSVRIGLE